MNSYRDKIILSLVGGIIAAIGGIAVAIASDKYKRDRDARDEFKREMSRLRGRISKENVILFFNTTKPDVKDVVYKLRPFLKPEKRGSLDAVWANYENIKPETDLNQIYESDGAKYFLRDMIEPRKLKPSQFLELVFDRFLAVAD